MAEGVERNSAGMLLQHAGAAFGVSHRSSGRAGALRDTWSAGRQLASALPARSAAALKLEAERGALFLFVPVLLGVGAALYFTAPFEPGLALLLLLLGGACALAFVVRRWRGTFLALSAAAVCLSGVLAAKVETLRLSTKMLGSEVVTRMTGRVVRVERLAAGRVRLTLDVLSTERPKLRYSPDRVRVTAAKLSQPPHSGMTVQGLVRLMPPSGPAMPGGYDFSFQSYFNGIGASGFFLGVPASLLPSDDAFGLNNWIENVRDRIAERIRGRIGGPEGEIAAALIVGVRGGIPDAVNEALRRTGLAHVLSISGLHMAMVAATVMGAVRALLALFPGFGSRRSIKKRAAAAALLVVSAYVAFSGADVAAVRSFLMLAVMLIAVLFDRAALSVRNLAIAAAVILLIWPHELLGPSFQMSFAATGALVAAYAAWADYRSARGSRTSASPTLATRSLRHGATMISALAATSLIAGAATAAFGIYHFQRVSPLSLPANLAVMPVVSVMVMPFALLGMLAMPFGLDGPFLAVMGLGLHWMIGITQWFSERSPIDAVGAIPPLSLALVVVALTGFTLATTWLRFVLLPLLVLAVLLASLAPGPDIFVSEDAKLISVATHDGSLAINAERGGGFALENWMHASAAWKISRPASQSRTGIGSRAAKRAKTEEMPPRFSCAVGLCSLKLPDGRTVAHASTAEAAAAACGISTILVIADASFPACAGAARPPVMLTKRDLALRGSAAIILRDGGSNPPAIIRYSVPQPLRPWHDHRQFSRAARGLAERTPRKTKAEEPRQAPASAE